jgi:putative redox protein
MTLAMYSKRKQWPLQAIEVRVEIERVEDQEVFRRKIMLTGPLDETQTQRLLEIANQCPVHRILSGKIAIQTQIDRTEKGSA